MKHRSYHGIECKYVALISAGANMLQLFPLWWKIGCPQKEFAKNQYVELKCSMLLSLPIRVLNCLIRQKEAPLQLAFVDTNFSSLFISMQLLNNQRLEHMKKKKLKRRD